MSWLERVKISSELLWELLRRIYPLTGLRGLASEEKQGYSSLLLRSRDVLQQLEVMEGVRPIVQANVLGVWKEKEMEALWNLLRDLDSVLEEHEWPPGVYENDFKLVGIWRKGYRCSLSDCISYLRKQNQALEKMSSGGIFYQLPRRLKVLEKRKARP